MWLKPPQQCSKLSEMQSELIARLPVPHACRRGMACLWKTTETGDLMGLIFPARTHQSSMSSRLIMAAARLRTVTPFAFLRSMLGAGIACGTVVAIQVTTGGHLVMLPFIRLPDAANGLTIAPPKPWRQACMFVAHHVSADCARS